MLGIEEVFGEVNGEDMEEKHGLPPGFRFHPTDEELIYFYLAAKVLKTGNYYGVKIAEVDLNRCEPWELPDEAKMGEREWYFFSLRVRKYPTGLRTNRATVAGYWKATGKDRQIYSASNGTKLGSKKTLVFYKGGAPRGEKTKWVMHEYRLHSDFPCRNMNTCKDEWVLCRIIQKSGDKIKPRHLQVESPSPTSLPPLEYHQSQSSRFQELHNFHHQENDLILESMIMNPQFVFQSNFLMTSFPSTIITADISPMLNDSHLPPPPSSQSSSMLLRNSLSSYEPCAEEEGADFAHLVDSTSTFAINISKNKKLGYSVDVADDHVKSSSIACEDHGCQI